MSSLGRACGLALAIALCACFIPRPDLGGKLCSSAAECGEGLVCSGGVCQASAPAEGEGEGEGVAGEGEGEGAAEGEGEGAAEGEGEGEGAAEGEGEGEGEGAAQDFEAWAPAQPDAGTDQNCLGMLYGETEDRTWRDRGCGELLPYVCQDVGQAPSACTLVELARPLAFCPTLSSFDDAQAACAGAGGSLLRVRDLEENRAVAAAAVAQFPAEPGAMFLGAHDRDREGEYRWLDGAPLETPSAFSPWEGNSPNGGDDEDCLELSLDANEDGSWSDCDCEDTQPYVCSIDPARELSGCTSVDVGGRRFAVCPTPVAHAAAAAACASVGGTLARIGTEAEQDAVVTAAKALVTVDAFLGGSDGEVEELWRWPDGSAFDDLRL